MAHTRSTMKTSSLSMHSNLRIANLIRPVFAAAQNKSGLNDAARSAVGKIGGHETSIAAMDFTFIGGSMGSVVGEIIARTIKRAYTMGIPLIIISQSGGARMMEGALSLMPMAKTSAHLARLTRRRASLHFALDQPDDGWGNRIVCHVGRLQYRGAQCADRVCRAARHPRNNRPGPPERISAVRISSRARIY